MGWVRDYYVVDRAPADNPTGYMVRHWMQTEERRLTWDQVMPRLDSLPADTFAAALDLIPENRAEPRGLPGGSPFNADVYWRVER